MTAVRHDEPGGVTPVVRLLTLLSAASLVIASLIHSGLLIDGYQHREAAIAEAVIGGVMLVGLALSWMPSPWGSRAAIGGLVFGLLGTSVGVFTIIAGVGPSSVPDLVYHGALLTMLIAGLVLALRSPTR